MVWALLKCCRSWFSVTRCAGAIALGLAVLTGVAMLVAQSDSHELPFQIQRVFLNPDRAAIEMEKVKQGSLVLLPRKDFESRVERARGHAQRRERRPHLAHAHYSAELIDRSLAKGSGRWTIQHATNAPAVLAIDSLSFALAHVRWEDRSDAILAQLDGKSLGLLVPAAGKKSCHFDWSARGMVTNDGLAFTLAVPPCPSSIFELRLPADRWLLAAKSPFVDVSGPHGTDSPLHRLWTIRVTGSGLVEFTVRQIADGPGRPIVLAHTHTTQKVFVDHIETEHEFQIDILHGTIRELILESKGALQPYAAALTGNEVKLGQWKETTGKKDPKDKLPPVPTGEVAVQFAQPVQGRIDGLRIKSLASRSPMGSWTSPALRVRGAVQRGEIVEIRLHPDVPVALWEFGSFLPMNSSVENDGTHIVTLANSARDSVMVERPGIFPPIKDLDLKTIEDFRWELTPDRAMLAAEVQFAPARGSALELRVKVPASYAIESLDVQPAGLLASWHPEAGLVVLRLKQPITPARSATLKLLLRSHAQNLRSKSHDLPFPEVTAIDAAKRQGAVAIVVDPLFEPKLLSTTVPPAPFDATLGSATYRFTFRDHPLQAKVRITPQIAQVRLRGKHEVTLSDQETGLLYRWEAKPLLGAPEYIDFRLPAEFPEEWNTVGSGDDALRVRRVERRNLADGVWRFHLSEPLRKPGILAIRAKAPAGLVEDDWHRISLRMPTAHPWENAGAAVVSDQMQPSKGTKRWQAPLMMPVQRNDVEQEIVVTSPNETIVRVQAEGVPQIDGPQIAKKPTQLRMAPSASTPRVELWTQPRQRSISHAEWCDEADLASFVYEDGRVLQRMQFRLWNWREHECELHIPADSRVLSIWANGRMVPSPRVTNLKEGVRVMLPVDRTRAFVRYEIIARIDAQSTFVPGLTVVSLPRVVFPIEPADVRGRFYLQRGLTPLFRESLTAIGVPAEIAKGTETLRQMRRIWNIGSDWLRLGESSQFWDQLDAQRQIVLQAEAQLRSMPSVPVRFGDALDRLALVHLKDAAPLVIDRLALQALGISPETALAKSAVNPQANRPFWESLGLIYVPCRHAALLTSAERMKQLGIMSVLEVGDLDDAIQEAIVHGHDACRGFFLVCALGRTAQVDATQASMGPAGLPSDWLGNIGDWDEWELPPTESLGVQLSIIDTTLARVAGWLLAALVALGLWRVQLLLEPRSCFRFYVLFTVAAILGVVWSPVQVREYLMLPVLLVGLIGFLWCIGQVLWTQEPTPQGTTLSIIQPAGTSAFVVLIVFGLAWTGLAQSPGPQAFTVFVLDGANPVVLAPSELINRLDELQREEPAGGPGAVLLSAKYFGTVKDAQAKFEVIYELHSFREKVNIAIPLSGPPGSPQTGVQLLDAFVDGAPAFPTPSKGGFSIPVRGKGAHTLRMSFVVRVLAEGDQFKLHFSVPKVVHSELSLSGLAPARKLHLLHGLGEEKWLPDAGKPSATWHADFGYESVVHLCWTNPAASPGQKTIDVKESHFWDLHPSAPALTSSLRYLLGKDSSANFTVSAPEGLQIRAIAAFRVASSTAAPTPLVVKRWNTIGEGDQRRLIVELDQPSSSDVILQIESVPPPAAKGGKFTLMPPAPLQAKSSGGSLAYRLYAKEVAISAKNLSVPSSDANEFEILGKKPTVPVTRAYRFERSAVKAWLEIVTQPNTWRAKGTLEWTVDSQHSDLVGNVTITSSHTDISLVEFFVDKSLAISQVTGPDVARWQVHAGKAQVWLKQPRKEAILTITGWRTATTKGRPPDDQKLKLPVFYPLNVAIGGLKPKDEQLTLEVRSAPGLQLKAGAIKGLRRDDSGAVKFIVEEPLLPYEVSLSVSAERQAPRAVQMTKVQGADQGFEIWHGVRLIPTRGYLPAVALHLDGWPESAIPHAPGGTIQRISPEGAKSQTWSIKYPQDLPQDVTITIRANLIADAERKMKLPTVRVENVAVRHQWLAWNGVELMQAGAAEHLSHRDSEKKTLVTSVPEDWHKGAAKWNYAQGRNAITAILPAQAAPTALRVLASSEVIQPTAAGWIRDSNYWIVVAEETDLKVEFPSPIAMLSASVDRRFAQAASLGPKEIALRLSASREPQLVQLRWRYVNDDAGAPNISSVKLEQAVLSGHQRVVLIPPTMLAPKADPSPTLAVRLLDDARTHMELCAALARESPSDFATQLTTRQHQFRGCIRQAEYALACLKSVRPDMKIADWQKERLALEDKNVALAKEYRYESVALKAKNVPAGSTLKHETRATGIPMLLPPTLADLMLATADPIAGKRTASELLILAGLFLLVASYFRHGWPLFQLVVPEVAIATIVVCLIAFGIGIIGATVLSALVIYRVFGLTVSARDWLFGTQPAPAVSNPSTAPQPITASHKP